ncbi:hypothetical protein M501DRAFT_904032, partial [Patellaria atrata CBS 101060]
GLNLQKNPAGKSLKSTPAPVKKKALFGDDDSDPEPETKTSNGAEEIGVLDLNDSSKVPKPASIKSKTTKVSKTSKPEPPTKPPNRDSQPRNQYANISTLQTQRKHNEEATALDPSIYDYDAAYDALNAQRAVKKAASQAEAAERKPKYMTNLLAAAELRKRDQLRAKDKVLQRERDEEGDEFADKEKFVTAAYKEQQAELRKAAEEEKHREEAEEKKMRSQGMTGFYRSVMAEDEKRHQEAMEALEKAKLGEIVVEAEPDRERSAAELARELNAKGANIAINDDGEVVDKRQMLSAGLNIAPKPKNVPVVSAAAAEQEPQRDVYQWKNSNKQAMRERQTRMMEAQLEQASKRAADEEAEERRKLEHSAKSRKTEGDIRSARERYLQRKKEAAAAK